MSELNFTHSNGNKVKLTTPDTLAANKTFKLPGADGSSGQFLKTDGSGALSFATATTSNYKITVGSVLNTGNATSETITGIPSDAVKVELLYYNLKLDATGIMAMRAGNASNIDSNNWFSAHTYVVNTNNTNSNVKTSGWSSRFQMPHEDFSSQNNRRTGIFTFNKHCLLYTSPSPRDS